jgi:insulysin
VAHIKPLTKADLIGFFKRFIDPTSAERAKLVVHLVAQAKSDVSTKQISELVKALDLESTETAQKAATDLQARLSAAGHDEDKEIEGLRDYLLHELKVVESKIDVAVEAWRKIHNTENGSASNGNGNANGGLPEEAETALSNGTVPVIVEDVRTFKAGLLATAGAKPARDLSEYEEMDAKL